MNRRIFTLILFLAAVGIMVGAVLFYNAFSQRGQNLVATDTTAQADTVGGDSSDSSEASGEADETPDFTVTDADGNSVKLSDFVGTPVVLNFWASWCGYCVEEMPDFDDAYAEYGENVKFLMLNATSSRETVEVAKSFIADKGFSFPVYFDTDGEAQSAFGISSLPITFFVAADGSIAAYGQGMLDRDTLNKGIAMIYDSNE